VAAIDAAIQRNPASWNLWFENDVLARLGLVPATPPAETADELQQSTR
jgi:hypothetical protein